MKESTPTLESTLKSSDTEEFIDIHFYRPIGYKIALAFQKRNISPNCVTIAGIFIGIIAGICFFFDDLRINLLGMCLLISANTLDSVDGQLARMTGNHTPLGRVLDGISGDLWFITIYMALSFRLMPIFGISIWLLAAIAGFFHSKQASMADYYRNIHLLFLKGKSGSEFDNSRKLKEYYSKLKWKEDFLLKVAAFFYYKYTSGQESWSPVFQKMIMLLHTKYGENIPSEFRNKFRNMSLPLMKWTNILSFNTRIIVLFLSLLFGHPWLYFVFELTVLNIILIYTVCTHEKMCTNFIFELEQDQENEK